jgi:branched-subunit amino acid aminotransferase/4-amino-4-deoxychorismate lyase
VGESGPVFARDRPPLRVVVLNGRRVDPESACLSIDDPAVRFGEGLLETMRAESGAVLFLDRHLDRLLRSAEELGLAPMPARAELERDVQAATLACPGEVLRVRLTATPGPTTLVEAQAAKLNPETTERGIAAVTVRGAWEPGHRAAEHKTIARAALRRADRRAAAAGAETALLLDERGRLGEATTANVFAVVGGEILTAPVRGILPGITRRAVLELEDVREEMLEEPVWRSAAELFLSGSVQGIVPVVCVDGAPVGEGVPGPVTRRVARAWRALADREARARRGEHAPSG